MRGQPGDAGVRGNDATTIGKLLREAFYLFFSLNNNKWLCIKVTMEKKVTRAYQDIMVIFRSKNLERHLKAIDH